MNTAVSLPIRSLAFRMGVNQLVCVGIALMLWAFGIDSTFWGGLVYSLL
ncbi:MAG: hypothetical protein JNM08_06125, partial [Rubrivivax sp.]|nr:hypothetical protein [Rubrivivax sp.]